MLVVIVINALLCFLSSTEDPPLIMNMHWRLVLAHSTCIYHRRLSDLSCEAI